MYYLNKIATLHCFNGMHLRTFAFAQIQIPPLAATSLTSKLTHTFNMELAKIITMMIDERLRTRDAVITKLEADLKAARCDIDTLKEKTLMLKDKVAGLSTANELMKQEMEAMKFRTEEAPPPSTHADTITKAVMKKISDAINLSLEPFNNLDTFHMDSECLDNLLGEKPVTSKTQPTVPKKQTRPTSPTQPLPKKQTGNQDPPIMVVANPESHPVDLHSPLRKKARHTISIGVNDPRRRSTGWLPSDVSDISDFSDTEEASVENIDMYSDDCPQTNLFGTYIHEYRVGGRRPKCDKCGNTPSYVKNKGSTLGFFYCPDCKLRYHKFVRNDGGRGRHSQQWFNTTR